MTVLFEAIKLIFFVVTIFLALVVTKGDLLFGPVRTEMLSTVLFPGYMVLVGILVGYVIALFIVGTSKEPLRSGRVMTNMFLVGIVLGIVFALVYIFVF